MWKNIKSLFVIEEEQSSSVKSKTAAKSSTKAPTAKQNVPASSTASSGKVNQKFMEVLLKAMDKNNIDGFDYLEYKQSLNSLKDMPMDEKTRYQSAMAMAKTMGGSPQQIAQTAQHYIDVLKQEENKFEQALANQMKSQVESKQKQILKLEETIKSKADRIKALTKEIEAHQQKQKTLDSEIKKATTKVESTKNDFIASFNSLVSQIQEDMDNIKQYLI
jgi:chromosome segregation ATPase